VAPATSVGASMPAEASAAVSGAGAAAAIFTTALCCAPQYSPVSVTACDAVGVPAWSVKLALAEPAGIRYGDCTASRSVLELATLTVAPPSGAGPVKAMVNVAV